VIAHRLGKNVELLEWKKGMLKLHGLQQMINDFPDVRELQEERIPAGFQKLRDTLRELRNDRK